MNKKVISSVLAIYLLLSLLLVPGPVRAGSGPAVLSTSAEMDFPASLTFRISAESSADITDIRLSYMVKRIEYARVVSEVFIKFTPANSVSTKWVWDMRKTGGLPPGSSVDYWWKVTDADGNIVETAPARINIEDSRYDWHSLIEGEVTLYWYQGDDSFAGELMAATQKALTQLAANTGAELENTVSIYIYASAADLQGSMIYPQEWTGGVAFTRYGIVAIGIAPNLSQLTWGKRVIAHELTHLVVHQVTFNPYNDLPTWLDEGLAVMAEGELDASFAAALDKARAENTLISVRSLASPFSAYAGESLLAYAESREVVTYLITEYGREKMFELLSAFRQGSGYDEALSRVYGFDMDGLNAEWKASFGGVAPSMPPVLVGILAGLASGLLLLASLFVESWAWRRGW